MARRISHRTYRRLSQIVLALTGAVIAIALSMVVTAAIDDIKLESNKASATAEVLSISPMNTSVRFRDVNENYHQPSSGLKYPSGLVEGQLVRVEYQANDPENVRVEGRTWTLAFRPALSTAALALAAGVAVWPGLRRARGATREDRR